MNNELLNYIRRHFLITDPKEGEKDQTIHIDGKNRYLNSSKKRIKKKIFEVIEEKFPYLVDDEKKRSDVMKTIKTYIDLIRKV